MAATSDQDDFGKEARNEKKTGVEFFKLKLAAGLGASSLAESGEHTGAHGRSRVSALLAWP